MCISWRKPRQIYALDLLLAMQTGLQKKEAINVLSPKQRLSQNHLISINAGINLY